MSTFIAHSLELDGRTKDVTIDENITFKSLMLTEVVLNGLSDSGFKKPSPIQSKAIPVGRCGFDIIVKSKSGTGKTLVFSIIALENIDIENHQPQVLIVAPTREIAVQIQEVLISIGSQYKGLKVETFIGGLSLDADKEKCKNCHIAVGTPGRIKHLISDCTLKSQLIHLFVLDEVDKLMEFSFISDINEIFNNLPDRKQIITTSATYPEQILTLLYKYMLSPTYIEIESGTPLLLGLKQFVKVITPHTSVVQEIKFKNEEILKLLSTISFTQCLIFTNYQTRAESISNFLNQKGWTSMYISAAQSQSQRLEVIKDLKNFKCKILLSTDLTARGIDIAKVDLVINYDIPIDTITYLHRMGRAGRYGSSGVCIDLVSSEAALHHWQNIIGVIGGSSLGVPKLPEFNGTVTDLLKIKILSEDCLFGTISDSFTPNGNTSIKSNVLDIKKKKKLQSLPEQEKVSVNNLPEPRMDESLNKISKTHLPVTNVNRPPTECEVKKFRKNIDLDVQKVKQKNDLFDNHIERTENDIYYKNKALLFVTKMLSNNLINILGSDEYALDYYLKMMKKCEKNEIYEIMEHTNFNGIDELLKNVEQFNGTYIIENEEKNIERIFEKGYQYATKYNSNHWSLYLPNSELSISLVDEEPKCRLDKFNSTESIYEASEYNNSDVQVATEEFHSKNKGDCSSEFTNWKSNKHCESSNWEHFDIYFNQCSENLWQSGLCFKNIEDFDNWFYLKWQTQVFSIRDYIQKNIYIQEMSQYQQKNAVRI